jgi:aspartyl/asparaginyl beta-hydroxylase (cupin superfamily)
MSAGALAKNGLIDKREFSKKINMFPKLKDAILSKRYSDVALIKMASEEFSNENPSDQEVNDMFSEKWRAYYNTIIKNK